MLSEIFEKRPHKWSYAFRILAHITDKVDFEIVCFSFRFFSLCPFSCIFAAVLFLFLFFWFIRFAVYKWPNIVQKLDDLFFPFRSIYLRASIYFEQRVNVSLDSSVSVRFFVDLFYLFINNSLWQVVWTFILK